MTEEQIKFKEAWDYHINQLNSLAFQATASPSELQRVKDILNDWINRTHTMKGAS